MVFSYKFHVFSKKEEESLLVYKKKTYICNQINQKEKLFIHFIYSLNFSRVMRKTLQKLCAFTALFVLSTMSSFAQYSGTATSKYIGDYNPTTAISFPLTDVAATLGTDTTTLMDAIDAFWAITSDKTGSFDKSSAPIDFLLVYNGTPYASSDHNQGDAGGWWMNSAGELCGWGVAGAIWYVLPDYDKENNTFSISCGQCPFYDETNGIDNRPPTDGVTCTASFQLTYNGKTATFDITYIIKPKNIKPTTDMKYSSLDIVKTINHTVSQPQTNSSKVLADTIVVEGLASALGIDAAELADDLDAHLFVRDYNNDKDPYLKDSIKSDFSGDSSNGYLWSKRINNEAEQQELDSCYSGAIDAEAVTVFRTQDIAFSNDTIFMNVGQYNGNAKEGSTYTGTILICNTEGKAFEVNVNLAVTKSEALPFTEMTCAGTYTSKITIRPGYSDATTVTIPTDIIAEIEEKTGVINGDAYSYAFADSTRKSTTDAYTANSSLGGFWFGKDGYCASVDDEDAAMYVEYVTAGNYSQFNVGTWVKTAIQDGDSTTASMLIVGDNSYYILDFCIKVKSSVGERENWNIVNTYEYDAQLIKEQGYAQADADGNLYTIKLEWTKIKSDLGMESVTATDIYAWDTYQSSWIPDSLTNVTNSCTGGVGATGGNGFYMSKDGRQNLGWSTNSAYAIYIASVSSDTAYTVFYVHPETVANTSKDTAYVSEIFVVNSDNGNVVKLVYNIQFVESVSDRVAQVLPAEEVGKETLTLVLSEDKDTGGIYMFDLDLAKACEALNLSDEELASAEWQVKKNSSGSLTVPSEGFEGAEICQFDSTGIYTTEPEDAAFNLGVETDPDVVIYVGVNGDVTEDTGFSTKIALVYDQKAYVFNLVIAGSEEKATGINSVSDAKENAVKGIYTLAGQRVNHASKGLYIINGKKVLVK